MKLLLQDEKVKVVLINIFGGITRCDDVAIGLIQAFDQIKSDIPVIVRLTGTNEHIGRDLLPDFDRFSNCYNDAGSRINGSQVLR